MLLCFMGTSDFSVETLILKRYFQDYCKSSIKPLWGLFNFGDSRGGLIREVGLLERGLIQKVR